MLNNYCFYIVVLVVLALPMLVLLYKKLYYYTDTLSINLTNSTSYKNTWEDLVNVPIKLSTGIVWGQTVMYRADPEFSWGWIEEVRRMGWIQIEAPKPTLIYNNELMLEEISEILKKKAEAIG